MSGSEVVCAPVPARWAAAMVLATALGACFADDRSEPLDQNGTSFTAVDEPVLDRGLVWADGITVHLGAGDVVKTDQELQGYVVAGAGVYGVPAGSDHLLEASSSAVEDTGARADPQTLRVSSDGRYLAFIDRTTGPTDSFDTPVAQTVVVDLVEGDEVVRTSARMTDPDDDDADLLALYEEGAPSVYGILDGVVYVAAPGGDFRVDAGGGSSEPEDVSTDDAWYEELQRPEALTSPDGSWTIVDELNGPTRLVPAGDGVSSTVSYGGRETAVNSWLDDDTAVGVVGRAGSLMLLECRTPTGRCAPVLGTHGGVQLPADRLGLDPSFVRGPDT